MPEKVHGFSFYGTLLLRASSCSVFYSIAFTNYLPRLQFVASCFILQFAQKCNENLIFQCPVLCSTLSLKQVMAKLIHKPGNDVIDRLVLCHMKQCSTKQKELYNQSNNVKFQLLFFFLFIIIFTHRFFPSFQAYLSPFQFSVLIKLFPFFFKTCTTSLLCLYASASISIQLNKTLHTLYINTNSGSKALCSLLSKQTIYNSC